MIKSEIIRKWKCEEWNKMDLFWITLVLRIIFWLPLDLVAPWNKKVRFKSSFWKKKHFTFKIYYINKTKILIPHQNVLFHYFLFFFISSCRMMSPVNLFKKFYTHIFFLLSSENKKPWKQNFIHEGFDTWTHEIKICFFFCEIFLPAVQMFFIQIFCLFQ